jgi:hypothetical protein
MNYIPAESPPITFQMIFENQYLQGYNYNLFFVYHVKTQLWFFSYYRCLFLDGQLKSTEPGWHHYSLSG